MNNRIKKKHMSSIIYKLFISLGLCFIIFNNVYSQEEQRYI